MVSQLRRNVEEIVRARFDTRGLERQYSVPLPVLPPEFPVLPGHPLVQLPVCDRDRELLGPQKEIRNELENSALTLGRTSYG